MKHYIMSLGTENTTLLDEILICGMRLDTTTLDRIQMIYHGALWDIITGIKED